MPLQEFRQKSVTARVASGYVCGAGVFGYEVGLRIAIQRVKEAEEVIRVAKL